MNRLRSNNAALSANTQAQENARGNVKSINNPTTVASRPMTRAALGDVNRNGPNGSKGNTGAAEKEVKKTGYGAHGQSRLLTRPPLHDPSTNNVPAPLDKDDKKANAGPSVFASKSLLGRVGGTAAVTTKPVTRSQSAAVAVTENTDVEMPSPMKETGAPTSPPAASPMMTMSEESMVSDDSGATGVSYSTLGIPDIDEDDRDDPQLAANFAADIYKYLRALEKEQTVGENFLQHKTITPRMRMILMDWLHQVHTRFHLLPETIYLTTHLIDRYLAKVNVHKDQLQLVGVTGMLIASKYEEMYAPEINDFVYITDDTYTAKEILAMEQKMLIALGFNLGRPLSLHFLRRFSKAGEADYQVHTLSKYLLELGTCEYVLSSVLPSHQAAAALLLTKTLLRAQETKEFHTAGLWTPTLIYYSGLREADFRPSMVKLVKLLLKVQAEKSKMTAVKFKFSTPKFHSISSLPCLSNDILHALLPKLSG